MAVKKQDYVKAVFGNQKLRATPLEYWKYGRWGEIVKPGFITPHLPVDNQGKPILQHGVIIYMDGYVAKESRAASRENDDLYPDFQHQFLIYNWAEYIVRTRPGTLEEKKANDQLSKLELDDEALEKVKLEILVPQEGDKIPGYTEVLHNDLDDYNAAVNTPEESATAYRILKTHPSSREFFKGAIDDI